MINRWKFRISERRCVTNFSHKIARGSALRRTQNPHHMHSEISSFIEANGSAALAELTRLACEEDQLEFTQKFFEVREGAPFIFPTLTFR